MAFPWESPTARSGGIFWENVLPWDNGFGKIPDSLSFIFPSYFFWITPSILALRLGKIPNPPPLYKLWDSEKFRALPLYIGCGTWKIPSSLLVMTTSYFSLSFSYFLHPSLFFRHISFIFDVKLKISRSPFLLARNMMEMRKNMHR